MPRYILFLLLYYCSYAITNDKECTLNLWFYNSNFDSYSSF